MKKSLILIFICPLIAGCGDEQSGATVSHSGDKLSGQDWLAATAQNPAYQEACAEVRGCAESRQAWTDPAETIWRLRIVRETDEQIKIERIERIEVVKDNGVPVGPLHGDALLVGLDKDGNALDGQLIRFPTTLFLEAGSARTSAAIHRPRRPESCDIRVYPGTAGYRLICREKPVW